MSDSTQGPAQGPSDPEPDRRRPPAYGQYASGGGAHPGMPGQSPPPPSGAGPSGPSGGSTDPRGGRVSVGQAFAWGWASYVRSAGAWIGAMIVVLMIGVAASVLLTPELRTVMENYDDPDAVMELVQTGATVTDVLLTAVLAVVEIVLGAVLAHGALAATRTGRATFGDFFALRNTGGIIALGIINGVLTLVLAFVPFLGPALRLVIGFFLAASLFFVIDGQDAVTAIRSSVRLVRRNLGVALATVVLVVVVSFVGFLLLLVGALVTVPVAMLAGAFVYRRLVGDRVAPPS